MREKRKHPRIGISFPVECKVLPSKDYFYTVSKDLSTGGAKILSSDFLVKDDSLKLNINLIDKVLSVKAKVSWCTKEDSSQRYSTGLEFVELTEPDRDELVKFLTKLKHS
jgi:c-di-GMP-binding flagellar brake protein YcgR